MELTRENFRKIIFYNFRRGLSQKQCLTELVSVFELEAPNKTAIYRWYSEFHRGRLSLTTALSSGRPKTAVTQENIDAVRKLLQEDRHVTYEQIQASLGIGMTAIQIILHEELGVRKLVSHRVPHNLTEEQSLLGLIGVGLLCNVLMEGAQMLYTILSQVMNRGSIHLSREKSNNRLYGSTKMKPSLQKFRALVACRKNGCFVCVKNRTRGYDSFTGTKNGYC